LRQKQWRHNNDENIGLDSEKSIGLQIQQKANHPFEGKHSRRMAQVIAKERKKEENRKQKTYSFFLSHPKMVSSNLRTYLGRS
jgi:hypothetical protein